MDSPAIGVQRTRDVLVLKDPDPIVHVGPATSVSDQRYETLWHLARSEGDGAVGDHGCRGQAR